MAQSLSGNTEQFKHSFREEAREILTDLEAALLELNESHDDADLIGRIFRGLHTLKGSGAMFGFEKMAAFTHDLENAYDQVRGGRLKVCTELVDVTLSALDQISAMLEEDAGGSVQVDESRCARILESVRELCGGQSEPAFAPKNSAEAVASPSGPMRHWQIRFVPGADLMRFGANPFLLLRELCSLGGHAVRAHQEAIPALADLDEERCYLWWEITLSTDADPQTLRDVFIFVEDACELTIVADGESAPSQMAEGTAAAPETDADRTARALEEKRSALPGRRAYDKPDNASSLRVPAARLDQLVNLVGELVSVGARLSELAARREDSEIAQVSEEIERLIASLRENSMNIRMMPIRGTFEKFRRLVHDLSRDLGKEVELAIEGADTELDKTVIDQLSDPLMHLIRNSMDHGIEPAELRMEQGKPAMATIRLSARYSGANVLVSVADDGRGIDVEAVHQRAVEKGLVTSCAVLSESEIYALLFRPGFSTAKQVTDVSGRGVGMDVVHQRVESLRGAIEVSSQWHEGTSVTLRLPLTLAIIDGLLVTVNGASFVLPLASTLECVELTRDDIARANGKHLAYVRGELVPYIRLREHFGVVGEPPPIEQIMLAETAQGRFGFVVDQVLGNCQTVIKNLGRFYRHVQFVSGATILGNGSVALILDPERLIQNAIHTEQHSGSERRRSRQAETGRETSVSVQGTQVDEELDPIKTG
jgi:two-component system, chemotaxis family, sensor kinase CheA